MRPVGCHKIDGTTATFSAKKMNNLLKKPASHDEKVNHLPKIEVDFSAKQKNFPKLFQFMIWKATIAQKSLHTGLPNYSSLSNLACKVWLALNWIAKGSDFALVTWLGLCHKIPFFKVSYQGDEEGHRFRDFLIPTINLIPKYSQCSRRTS